MEMVPSALYRYYASRDDLITALIVDAFDALAIKSNALRDDLKALATLLQERIAELLTQRLSASSTSVASQSSRRGIAEHSLAVSAVSSARAWL